MMVHSEPAQGGVLPNLIGIGASKAVRWSQKIGQGFEPAFPICAFPIWLASGEALAAEPDLQVISD